MYADARFDDLRERARSRHADVRRRAANRLGHFRAPQAVEALVSLLMDGDPTVRLAAISSLGRIHDPRCREALERFLCENRPDSRHAAEVLVSWGEASVPALLRALQGTTPTRMAAAQALGRLRERSAVPALVSVLSSSTPELVDTALRALIRIGNEAALSALAEGLERCTPGLRLEIIALLRERGDRDALPALYRQMTHPLDAVARQAGLAVLDITEPSPLIREHLQPLFGGQKIHLVTEPRLIPALLLALEHGRDPVQANAARWLGHLARHAPRSELREAIPILKGLMGFFSGTPGRDREVMAGALRSIEESLDHLADRPIPSQAAETPPRDLPIPGN